MADTDRLLDWLETDLAEVDFAAIGTDYPDVPAFDLLDVPPWAEQPQEPSTEAAASRHQSDLMASGSETPAAHAETPSQHSTVEMAPTVDALARWLLDSAMDSDLPTEQIDERVADFQHVLEHDELASSTTGARLAAARHRDAEAGTTSRAGHAKGTKTRVTGDLLLRVARSLLVERSIARAAKVNKMSSSQTTRYLTLQGLTPKGMRAAGQEADRINGLIRAFAAGKRVWIDRAPRTPMTGDKLLSVARALPSAGSISAAARANKMEPQAMPQYLSRGGLTRLGTSVAGEKADEIDRLIRAFAAGNPVWVDRAPRTPMTGDKLLSVARALQSAGSISAAARANKMAPQAIAKYLSRGGLTRLGTSVAGEKADEIDRLVCAFTPGQLNRLPFSRPQMTGDILFSIATSLPAEGSIAAAATAINISTRLVEAHLRVKGLTEKGRIAAGEKADEIDRLVRAFYERPAAAEGAMTADSLLAVVRLSLDAPIASSAAQLGIPSRSVWRHLSLTGLTTEGRHLAGRYAPEIDALMASRLERVRLRYAGALAREPVPTESDDGVLRDEMIRSTEAGVQSQESDGDDFWQELITAIDFDAQSEDTLLDEGARVASHDTNAASPSEIASDFEHDAYAISSPASRAGSDDESPAKRPRYQ